MNSPNRHAEISHVACVTLMPNSGMSWPNPGPIPVMQKLHRADSHKTDQKARTLFAKGQFWVHISICHP